MRLVDVTVIAILLPIAAVTPYALGASVVAYFDKLIAPISRVFFPAVTALHAKGQTDDLRKLYLHGSRFLLLFAVCGGTIAAVYAAPFFQLWVGSQTDHDSIVSIFSILICATIITAGQRIGYQVFLGTINVKPLAIMFLAEATINITLSIILGQTMGLAGIAIATLVAASLFHGIGHPILVCRSLEIGAWQYLSKILIRPILVGVALWVSCEVLITILPPAEFWLMLALHGVVAFVAGAVIIVFIGMSRSERSEFLTRRFKRKSTRQISGESQEPSSQVATVLPK